jgi:hypothetical protein
MRSRSDLATAPSWPSTGACDARASAVPFSFILVVSVLLHGAANDVGCLFNSSSFLRLCLQACAVQGPAAALHRRAAARTGEHDGRVRHAQARNRRLFASVCLLRMVSVAFAHLISLFCVAASRCGTRLAVAAPPSGALAIPPPSCFPFSLAVCHRSVFSVSYPGPPFAHQSPCLCLCVRSGYVASALPLDPEYQTSGSFRAGSTHLAVTDSYARLPCCVLLCSFLFVCLVMWCGCCVVSERGLFLNRPSPQKRHDEHLRVRRAGGRFLAAQTTSRG